MIPEGGNWDDPAAAENWILIRVDKRAESVEDTKACANNNKQCENRTATTNIHAEIT